MTVSGVGRTGVPDARRASRRALIAAITLVLGATLLAVAGPWVWHHYLTRDGAQDIHDIATLPRSLHPCSRSYGGHDVEPQTRAELRALGPEPPIVDTLPLSSCLTGLSVPCPAGTCTPTRVWVRVGEDAYIGYSLRGGP